MELKEFIEKAIRGGWTPDVLNTVETILPDGLKTHSLLDPKAWQAVGKVEGWNLGMCVKYYQGRVGGVDEELDIRDEKEISQSEYYMHQMIDALAEGKSIESFIKTL